MTRDLRAPSTSGRGSGRRLSTISRCGAPLLRARVALDFVSRLRGLHAVGRPGAGDALIIRPCRSVHTFGLGYPIDVVFVDDSGLIVSIDSLKVGRIAWCRRAHAAIEMAAGTAERLGFKPGQILNFSCGDRT